MFPSEHSTLSGMREVASRRSNLPPPPWVVFEDLCHPTGRTVRAWLRLRDDETEPLIIESDRPQRVVWSSLWPQRPGIRVRFDLSPERDGTHLRATLYAGEPAPAADSVRHMRSRIGELIYAELRHTYGQ